MDLLNAVLMDILMLLLLIGPNPKGYEFLFSFKRKVIYGKKRYTANDMEKFQNPFIRRERIIGLFINSLPPNHGFLSVGQKPSPLIFLVTFFDTGDFVWLFKRTEGIKYLDITLH